MTGYDPNRSMAYRRGSGSGIDGQGVRSDVDKAARSTGLRQRLGRRNEGVGDGNDFVAGTDAEGLIGEAQRVGAAAYGDSARRPDERSELPLEFVDFGAAHERRRLDGAAEGVDQLTLQRPMRRDQIQKRDSGRRVGSCRVEHTRPGYPRR